MVYDASSNTENGISDDISVYLYGSATEERAIKATYVGGSIYYDIAVLRVEDSELLKDTNVSQIEISDSDKVIVGDSAIDRSLSLYRLVDTIHIHNGLCLNLTN